MMRRANHLHERSMPARYLDDVITDRRRKLDELEDQMRGYMTAPLYRQLRDRQIGLRRELEELRRKRELRDSNGHLVYLRRGEAA
jgi:hypothetical protein